MSRRATAILPCLLALAALAVVLTGSAAAERAQKGNLIVSLNARLTPHALPRVGQAPATVRLRAAFATDDGSRVPQLRTMAVVLGTRGQFDATLPICRLSGIRATSASQALRACGPALVGHGRLAAEIFLPGQERVPFVARLLAFNGVSSRGRPLILADVHSKNPPVSFVMRFLVKPIAHGTATALIAKLPAAAGQWAHVERFDLTLGRRFQRDGETHSFVNAGCPAPAGFGGLVFPFAEATYGFAGGKAVSAAVIRGCQVRKEVSG
jgi:hypothetical protein